VRTSPAETTQAVLTTTEAAVLGLLMAGEQSGYDLVRSARGGVGYIWEPTRSRIYAVLPRLVAAGLAARRDVAQEDRPDKQVHRITPAGRRAFLAWLREPDVADHDRFLLRVFFGRHLPPRRLERLVRAYRDRVAADLETYRGIEERISRREEDRYGYLTLRWGIAAAQARLAWADAVLGELAA
jgi:PadR family transcriptional regulator AphA